MSWLHIRAIPLIAVALLAANISAQDAPRPVLANARATVHQFGIIRHSSGGLNEADLQKLPGFVHRMATRDTTSTCWLEFSAVYIVPPQMTTSPLVLQAKMKTGPGLTAWYPFASATSDYSLEWADAQIGVQADCLRTTSSHWMIARAMDAAATVKLYKPGPAGSQRDDIGTTEGENFLFARAMVPGAEPLSVERDAVTNEWIIRQSAELRFTDGTATGWIAKPAGNGEIISRALQLSGLNSGDLKTSATVENDAYQKETAQIRAQLNEALSGNVLRPDEAAAQAELVLASIANTDNAALVYILPPRWVELHFPLEISGAAEEPVRVFVGITKLP